MIRVLIDPTILTRLRKTFDFVVIFPGILCWFMVSPSIVLKSMILALCCSGICISYGLFSFFVVVSHCLHASVILVWALTNFFPISQAHISEKLEWCKILKKFLSSSIRIIRNFFKILHHSNFSLM